MAIDLLMPKLGLTMTEGVLLEWKVRPGDAVARGQLLYVIETDKIATEVEAEADGVLEAQLVAEGETVPVGAVVGRLAGSDEASGAKPRPNAATEDKIQVSQPRAIPASPVSRRGDAQRIVATPLARRMARAHSLDLAAVTGSGPRGRIKAIDVERTLGEPRQAPEKAGAGNAIRAKPSATQAAMARRLAEVKQGVPHFYLSTEIEVSALIALRETLNADATAPRLTLNHFVLAARWPSRPNGGCWCPSSATPGVAHWTRWPRMPGTWWSAPVPAVSPPPT